MTQGCLIDTTVTSYVRGSWFESHYCAISIVVVLGNLPCKQLKKIFEKINHLKFYQVGLSPSESWCEQIGRFLEFIDIKFYF